MDHWLDPESSSPWTASMRLNLQGCFEISSCFKKLYRCYRCQQPFNSSAKGFFLVGTVPRQSRSAHGTWISISVTQEFRRIAHGCYISLFCMLKRIQHAGWLKYCLKLTELNQNPGWASLCLLKSNLLFWSGNFVSRLLVNPRHFLCMTKTWILVYTFILRNSDSSPLL